MSSIHLPASGPYSIPSIASARLDETREQRLARHLAWCDLLHRDRLAATAELGSPRLLPRHLRLVAPPRAVPPASPAKPEPSPRRVLSHEAAFFATVLASVVCTFISASLSTPRLIGDVVAIAGSIDEPATLR